MFKSDPDKPVLWAIKDIASHRGISIRSVYRYIDAGFLPKPEKPFGWRRWERGAVVKALRKVGLDTVD